MGVGVGVEVEVEVEERRCVDAGRRGIFLGA